MVTRVEGIALGVREVIRSIGDSDVIGLGYTTMMVTGVKGIAPGVREVIRSIGD